MISGRIRKQTKHFSSTAMLLKPIHERVDGIIGRITIREWYCRNNDDVIRFILHRMP